MRYFLDILTVSLKLWTRHVAQMKANSEPSKTYSNFKIWPQYEISTSGLKVVEMVAI